MPQTRSTATSASATAAPSINSITSNQDTIDAFNRAIDENVHLHQLHPDFNWTGTQVHSARGCADQQIQQDGIHKPQPMLR